MKKILLLLLLLFPVTAIAADNSVILTPGSGVTMRTKDIGAGVQSPLNILGDTSGSAIYGTAGSANANVLSVQGIASGTALSTTVSGTVTVSASTVTPVSGTFWQTTQPVSIAGTVAISPSGVTAVSQSGTWTVQPGNTPNTTAWKVDGSAVTQPVSIASTVVISPSVVTPVSGTFWQATQPVSIAGTVTITASNITANVAQINGVTPLMGNGGTGTGSQRVTIASDNTAFSVNATLGAETTKVIGTVRNVGNIGGVIDAIGQNVAAPANWWQVGCQFNTTPTTVTNTNGSPCQIDSAGRILIASTAADPCQNVVKTYTPISITTATTTRIVSPTSGKRTYICYMLLTSAAADNVGIVEGTGGTCGSGTAGVIGGTTAANGPNFGANSGVAVGNGGYTAAATAGSNVDLCLITSAATPLAGTIAWVQAP